MLKSLVQYIIPGDQEVFELNSEWYSCIYDMTLFHQPKVVVEFGTRAGYSSRAVFEAKSDCKVISYDGDIDEQSKGYWKHAIEINRDFDFVFIQKNTKELESIQKCDLVLVDADHSFLGCLHEIQVASKSTDLILVDDFNDSEEIRNAIKEFLDQNTGWYVKILTYGNKEVGLLKFNKYEES